MSFLPSRPSRVAVMAIVLGLSMMAVIACGGSEGSNATTTEASPASASTTVAAPAETTTSSASAANTGEIGGSVSVSSSNGGYPTSDIPDWSQIKSVVAFRNASYGVASIFVCLATDEISAGSINEYWELPSPAAGQGRVELLLTRTLLDVNEPPLVPGIYDFDTPQGKAELTGEAKILVADGVGIQFVSDDNPDYVEVTAVSDTEISGTFKIGDKWSQISGTFTAPVK
jgi:hypothetical protein